MAAGNREAAISVTLGYEGGYTNHPRDPGGPTNWGITIYDARKYWKEFATADDVKAMPKSVAIDIYRQRYWAPLNCDNDPDGVDLVTFDYGVNSGLGRARPCRDRNKKDDPVVWVKAICAERLAFLKRLGTWSTFGKGWGARVANVEARGVKMALQAKGAAPDAVNASLKTQAKAATNQANKEATKAGGVVAGPAVAQQGAGHDLSWLPPWAVALVIAAIAVGVGIFIWNYVLHKQRAAAYAAVAQGA